MSDCAKEMNLCTAVITASIILCFLFWINELTTYYNSFTALTYSFWHVSSILAAGYAGLCVLTCSARGPWIQEMDWNSLLSASNAVRMPKNPTNIRFLHEEIFCYRRHRRESTFFIQRFLVQSCFHIKYVFSFLYIMKTWTETYNRSVE